MSVWMFAMLLLLTTGDGVDEASADDEGAELEEHPLGCYAWQV